MQLEEKCGRYFSFRDLIQCGETQARTGIENLPTQSESYGALRDLAECIIDPTIEQFGPIRLTYGFCSSALARQIPGKNAPSLDQHAAHELNAKGNLICTRLGAAVDFVAEGRSMIEVAQWIVGNCEFDRMYIYGDDRPIHVSFGPNGSRQIVLMKSSQKGRRVPRVVSESYFLALRVENGGAIVVH
jgi:hypothetical protein